jgi:tRNA pseudouridine38-40 synthase
MRNLKLVLAYDGSVYHGWQRQPRVMTIQSIVEQAARRVLRHQVYFIGAGRTDAGVHAAGQQANFYTTVTLPAPTILHALGSRVPKDISLLHLRNVPLSFHATRSAVSKLYRYRVYAAPGRPVESLAQRFTYHFWHPLDIDAMRAAAAAFIGTHDFTAMASKGNVRTTNVRTVLRCDIYRVEREVRFDIIGTGFLYNQVRNMVGTLLEVGRGHWPPEHVAEIMQAHDRKLAGPTAPARGLCLQWVRYDLPSLPADDEIDPRFAATQKGALFGADQHPRPSEPGARSSTVPVLPPGIDLDEEPSG